MKYYNKKVLRQSIIVCTILRFPNLREVNIVRTMITRTDIVRTMITFANLRKHSIVRTTCMDQSYNVSTKCNVVRTMLKIIGNIPRL